MCYFLLSYDSDGQRKRIFVILFTAKYASDHFNQHFALNCVRNFKNKYDYNDLAEKKACVETVSDFLLSRATSLLSRVIARFAQPSKSLWPAIEISVPRKIKVKLFQVTLCASNLRDFSHEHALVIVHLISKICDHLSLVCFRIKPRFVYQLN